MRCLLSSKPIICLLIIIFTASLKAKNDDLRQYDKIIIKRDQVSRVDFDLVNRNILKRVQHPNQTKTAPVFQSTPIEQIAENDFYRYRVEASDEDGDAVSIRSQELPEWLTLIPGVEDNVTTFAGSVSARLVNGQGDLAVFETPYGVAVDADGNIYVADSGNNVIRKVSREGVVTTFAGNGKPSHVDGVATEASFNQPIDLVFDSNGNLFVTDFNNNRIRKITPEGVVSTLAGSGARDRINGNGIEASFIGVRSLVIDANDNLFVADREVVRQITPAGEVSTYAEVPGNMRGLAIDADGNIYTGEVFGAVIRKINTNREVSFLAGSGNREFADGTGAEASFSQIEDMVIGPDGHLYVSSDGVRQVTTQDGVVTRVLGATVGNQDGIGTEAQFIRPTGLAFDNDGVLIIIDGNAGKIRLADTDLQTSTLAGGFSELAPDAPVEDYRFYFPADVAVSKDGNTVYVTSPEATVTIVDGEVKRIMGIDGSDRETVNGQSLHLLENGELLISDGLQIWKLDLEGKITLFAGTEEPGNQNGPRLQASFSRPRGMTSDLGGNIYVVDETNNAIRKIDLNGEVTTLAGSGNFAIADGQGQEASFRGPFAITHGKDGNLYVTDSGGGAIRKVSLTGEVSTLIDSSSGLSIPRGITYGPDDLLYVSNTGMDRIWRVTLEGEVSEITGNSYRGFNNGIGVESSFNQPWGLTFDVRGDLLIADSFSHLVRKMSFGATFLEGDPEGQLGEHNVVLLADDGNGETTEQSFVITVSPKPPTITSQSTTEYDENGSGIVYTITATDPNTITYGLGVEKDESLFNIDENSGEVSFMNPPDFEDPQDQNEDNVYEIDVTADNGEGVASMLVLITINNISDVAPIYTSSPVESINDDSFYRYDISTFDGDGETPVVSATTLPEWLEITSEIKGDVSILAGDVSSRFIDGSGTGASFDGPSGIAVDSDGNVFVADTRNHRIRKVSPEGDVTTFAGSGRASYEDGSGIEASFNQPIDLVFDAQGNLFVTDFGNNRIRKITNEGAVTTFAGSGNLALVDGNGVNASFRQVRSIVVDDQDNLYVACQSTVRKITVDGDVSTYAGNEDFGSADGVGNAASFGNIWGLAIDVDGNLFTGEIFGAVIRKIDTNREVSFLAGSGSRQFMDGNSNEASFSQIEFMTVGPDGDLYVSSDGVRKVNTTTGETIRVLGETRGTMDGVGVNAQFLRASGLAFDSNDNLWITDRNAGNIRVADTGLSTTTVAGGAETEYSDGTRADVNFYLTRDIAVTTQGDMFITSSGPLRKLTSVGLITTVMGAAGSDLDSPQANYVHALSNGEILMSVGGVQLYKMLTDGVIVLFAGQSTAGTADGDRLQTASFSGISGITSDENGNIYIADRGNNKIRKISAAGMVTTLAGSGDLGLNDGIGEGASFFRPLDITIGSDGNLYVTDSGNNAVRRVSLSGQVTTLVSGQDQLSFPRGITSGPDGMLYVSVGAGDLVKRLTLNGELSTIIGSGYRGYNPGVGIGAALNRPEGLTFDNEGNLLIADQGNHMIRRYSGAGGVFIEGSAIGQSGSHNVVLEADDQNGGVATQSFTIEIVDVTVPVFLSPSSVSIQENSSGSIYLTMAEDTNPITYALGSDLDESQFELDENSGALSFLSIPDFEAPLDANGDNVYNLQIIANDGTNETVLNLNITVEDVDPEAILSVTGGIDIPATALGLSSNFSVTIANEGGASLEISEITYPDGYSGPTGNISLAESQGQEITFTFSPIEARLYSGEIVILSNGGIARLLVSANGEIITSIDQGFENNVQVYPNPAKSVLSIDLDGLTGGAPEVIIYDVSGIRYYKNEKVRSTMLEVDVRSFKEGLYIIQIVNDLGVTQRKIMIQK